MRIGIDIDGVITNLEQWRLECASKFYYEKYNKKIIDYKGYETTEIFNVSEKFDDEFWITYYKEYSFNIEPRKFASEVINKLKEEGNEIYIITARGSFLMRAPHIMNLEENKNIVLDWLNKNDIHYNKIIFSPEDKLQICLQNNIDVMIEDKSRNIMNISAKIPVICFHANYNDFCKGQNITRCYSWYDIYAKISENLI